MLKQFLVFLCVVIVAAIFSAADSQAATFTITSNTAWSAIAGGPPTAADAIVVKNGATLTVDVGTAVALSVQLGAGGGSSGAGTLAFNAASQLTVSGAVNVGASNYSGTVNMTSGGTLIAQSIANTATGSGTFTFTPGAGTLRITATSSIPAALTSLYNFNVSTVGATVTLSADLTVTNVLTLGGGTLDPSFFVLTLSGTGTPAVVGGYYFPTNQGTVRYTGDGAKIARTRYYNLECKPNGSNPQILGTGAAQTIEAYGAMIVGDGTVGHAGATGTTYNPAVAIYGSLTVAANATLVTGSSNYSIYGGGTPVVVNGTLTASTNNTFIYFSAGQHVAPINYYNLTLTGDTLVLDAGNLTVAGQLGVPSSTPDTSSNPNVTVRTMNVQANYTTGTGTFTFTGPGTPLFGVGTFTASGGSTVVYTGDGATIRPQTYSNLQLKPSGSTPIDLGNGTTTVNGNLTIGDGVAGHGGATGATYNSDLTVSGTLTIAANADFTTGSGTITLPSNSTPFVKTGTLTASTGNTFKYTGVGATSPAATYYNLEIQDSSPSWVHILGGGTYTVNGTMTVSGGGLGASGATNNPTVNANALTIAASTSYATGTGTLTISGNFTNSGNFSNTGGTVAFNDNTKTSILTYNAATTFNNLSVTTGGKTIKLDNVDQTNVTGVLTLTGSDCTTGRVFLASDSAGVQAELNVTGSASVTNTDIRDTRAVVALTASGTSDNDNNTNWTINACGGGGGGGGNVFGDSVWGDTTIK